MSQGAGSNTRLKNDHNNVFERKKLERANLEIFSSDVLMEGELNKKGEMGFQTWKTVSAL
jgi:hypothetical protein